MSNTGEEIRSMIHVAYEKRNDPDLTFGRILDICRTLLEHIESVEKQPAKPDWWKTMELTMTAEEKRLRTAILEVLDFGHPDAEGNGTWTFYETEEQPAVSEDEANANRISFADQVIARARALIDYERALPNNCSKCGGPRDPNCPLCQGSPTCCNCRLGGQIRTLANTWLPQIKTRHTGTLPRS